MLGTSSRHSAKRSLTPRTVSRYAFWSSRVTSPTPISWSSTERNRRHLGGRPAHEHLVGEVEVGADQRLLDHLVAEVARDLDDRVARDPVQDPGREVGRVDHAVADDEDRLARAVGDVPVRREQDRLVVARLLRLGDREHRVQVDAGRLRGVRDDVRRDPLPARDLRADARPERLLAEVGAPRPRHDRDLDRVPARRDAELAEAVEGDRADVALGEAVRARAARCRPR